MYVTTRFTLIPYRGSVIRLPVPGTGVTAVERFALDVLVDLARLVPTPPAIEAAQLELVDSRHRPGGLHAWVSSGWGIEATDGVVRVPRAALRAVVAVAGAEEEQRATARDHYGRVPSSENAYCSPTPNKNYINLLFRGGAADVLRRSRRTQAIANILQHYGFATTLNADVVIGRLNTGSLEETRVQLEMIGRLLQFFRQMDAAMASDEHMQVIQEAFLAEDFSLSVWTGQKKGEASTAETSK